MGFFNTIRSWAEANTERYIYEYIPNDRIDIDMDDTPLEPDASYFRIWLTEMYLAKSREWFTQWYPAVQASVNLKFGDAAPMLFSRVVRAPDNALARGVLMNYALTDLIPYRGGIVEVEAALMAFRGAGGTTYLGSALGLLETFGGLVAPPLGQAVQIAQAVNKGIDDLISQADGTVHLSLHQAFISGNAANAMRGGFIAVVLATEEQVNSDALTIKENRLMYQGQPLVGYDYMLLQIERRAQRDDWQLSYIDELMDKIANAYAFGRSDEAETFQQALKFAVFDSDDFTFQDKVRVLRAIKQRIQILAEPISLEPEGAATLNEIIRRDQGFFPKGADEPKTPEDLLKIF